MTSAVRSSVPALPFPTHHPNLAPPRSSSSAPTSPGGQLCCLCTACAVRLCLCVQLFSLSTAACSASLCSNLPPPSPCTAPHGTAPHGNMAGTSTALQALLQGQRADRIQAFRSLGAQRIVQLESELAEARMTLFGPLPAAAAAPPVDTAPSRTSAPPAKQQAQPPPPAQPAPPPAKTPPPREATPPRSATPTPRPPRRDQTPPRRTGHWGRQRWADADEDEWDELGHADAAASTAPHAQPWKGKGKGKAEWEHMQGPAWGPHSQPYSPWGGPAPWPHPAPHGPPMWGYPPPPPPHAQPRPAPRGIEVSPLVRTEVRWVNNPNGEARPCYMDRGTVKCAAKCEYNCRFGYGPCNKPLRSPPSSDCHAPHRCSKCKQAEEEGTL